MTFGAPNTTATTMSAPTTFISSRTPPSYQGKTAGYSLVSNSTGGPVTAHQV